MPDFSVGLGPKIQNITTSDTIETKSGLVLIDASQEHVDVTLPHPSSYKYNMLAVVAKDVTLGINLVLPEDATWLDDSNVSLDNKGDSLLLVADRDNQWVCIARYNGYLAY